MRKPSFRQTNSDASIQPNTLAYYQRAVLSHSDEINSVPYIFAVKNYQNFITHQHKNDRSFDLNTVLADVTISTYRMKNPLSNSPPVETKGRSSTLSYSIKDLLFSSGQNSSGPASNNVSSMNQNMTTSALLGGNSGTSTSNSFGNIFSSSSNTLETGAFNLKKDTFLNTKSILVLLHCLINVDIGDKMTKANRFASEIVNVDFDFDQDCFILFQDILLFLKKSLRLSIQFVLQPFIEIINDFLENLNKSEATPSSSASISHSSPDSPSSSSSNLANLSSSNEDNDKKNPSYVISVYRLLYLLIRYFPDCLVSKFRMLFGIFNYGIQLECPGLSDLFEEILKYLLNKKNFVKNKNENLGGKRSSHDNVYNNNKKSLYGYSSNKQNKDQNGLVSDFNDGENDEDDNEEGNELNKMFESLLIRMKTYLNSSNTSYIKTENIVRLLYVFIDNNFTVKFNFNESYVDSKIREKNLSTFCLIPLFFKTNYDLFSKENTSSTTPSSSSPQKSSSKKSRKVFKNNIDLYLDMIRKHLSKKDPNRLNALMSIGDFIFNRKADFPFDAKTMNKCKKKVLQKLDSEQSCYALIAILLTDIKTFLKESAIIFSQPLSNLTVLGFLKAMTIHNDLKHFIKENILISLNQILFSANSLPSKIAFAFQSLILMDIGSQYVNKSLMVRYFIHLYNNEYDVRKEALNYLLYYYYESPTIEVVQEILVFISIEQNDKLRVNVLTQFNKINSNLIYKENNHINIFDENELIISSITPLLHDPLKQIQISVTEFLITMINKPFALKALCSFLQDSLKDINKSNENNEIDANLISCFLIIARASFLNPPLECTEPSLNIFIQFAPQITQRILTSSSYNLKINESNNDINDNYKQLHTVSLEFLSYGIKVSSSSIDVNLLAYHIGNSLNVHSTPHRLNVSLSLLISALQCTSLSETIYKENSFLINKLMNLTKLHSNDVSFNLLTKAITMVGTVDPLVMKEIRNSQSEKSMKLSTTNIYLVKSNTTNPLEKLLFTSVGVAFSAIFDILSNDSLLALHTTAIDALLTILKMQQQIGPSLVEELFKLIHYLLISKSISTVSVLFPNMLKFLAVLGDRFIPLVPLLVELIFEEWNNYDRSILGKNVEWLMAFLPESMSPFLPRLATLFVTSMDELNSSDLSSVLAAIVSFGAELNYIDYIIFPAILNSIPQICFSNSMMIGGVLSQLKDMLLFGGAEKFAGNIIRTMIHVNQINPSLTAQSVLKVLEVVAVKIGPKFLLYLPMIKQYLYIENDQEFLTVIKCYETKTDLPQNILFNMNPINDRRANRGSQKAFKLISNVEHEIVNKKLQIPKMEYDRNEWVSWNNEFWNALIKHSVSHPISACGSLASRYTILRDVLSPISLVLYLIKEDKDTSPASSSSSLAHRPQPVPTAAGSASKNAIGVKLEKIIDIIFSSKSVPKIVLRQFLMAFELMEVMELPLSKTMLQFSSSSSTTNSTIKAIVADLLPQALRSAEAEFEKVFIFNTEQKINDQFSEDTEKLEKIVIRLATINQKLGLTVSGKSVQYLAIEKGLKTLENNDTLKEKLGLWSNALESYNKKLKQNKNLFSTSNDISQMNDIKSSTDNIIGKFKCLNALLRFEELRKYAHDLKWYEYEAIAAFRLFDLDGFIKIMKECLAGNYGSQDNLNSIDSKNVRPNEIYMFCSALYYTLTNNYKEAKNIISKLYNNSYKKLFPKVYDYYEHAMNDLCEASLVTEIDELIKYQLMKSQIEQSTNLFEKEHSLLMMDSLKESWLERYNKLPNDASILFNHLSMLFVIFDKKDSKLRNPLIRFLEVALTEKKVEIIKTLIKNDENDIKSTNLVNDLDLEVFKAKVDWKNDNKEKAMKEIDSLLTKCRQDSCCLNEGTKEKNLASLSFILSKWNYKIDNKMEAIRLISDSIKFEKESAEYWKLLSTVSFDLYTNMEREYTLKIRKDKIASKENNNNISQNTERNKIESNDNILSDNNNINNENNLNCDNNKDNPIVESNFNNENYINNDKNLATESNLDIENNLNNENNINNEKNLVIESNLIFENIINAENSNENKEITVDKSNENLNKNEEESYLSQINYYLLQSFEASLNGLKLMSNHSILSFTLRIISILLRRGNKIIYKVFSERFQEVPTHIWLDVLIQIIARLNSDDVDLREIIQNLLYQIGIEHPQSIFYSLLVPLKNTEKCLNNNNKSNNNSINNSINNINNNSNNNEINAKDFNNNNNIDASNTNMCNSRQQIAKSIVEKLSIIYPKLAKEILQFSDELIRVASSWWETWFTVLDDATKLYNSRHNCNEAINSILPCFDMVFRRKPETLFEVSFIEMFSLPLQTSIEYIEMFQRTKKESYFHTAWSILVTSCRQMRAIFLDIEKISLNETSPTLCSFKEMSIIVPGTIQRNAKQMGSNDWSPSNNSSTPIYEESQNERTSFIRIQSINEEVFVMKSKQRPRRLVINGTNGKAYTFLLKAHEDTRLDERVMQLFSYINAVIAFSELQMKQHLSITTYQVIPITGEVGLIGWVTNCSTLFSLIKDYRTLHGIDIEEEFNKSYINDYNNADLKSKVVYFNNGVKSTKGDDLKKLLLINAEDSSHWLKRRIIYSTSLALTSVSGYILGLGDRHMQNIMMKHYSAKLVHIDFGDCFEVAQHRSNFPEKVPFRLTRMLTNALEVTKINGIFRNSMENVFELLKNKKKQIIGLLEVFNYDPLIQWIYEDSLSNNNNSVNNNNSNSNNSNNVNSNDMNGQSSSNEIVKRIKDKLTGKDFMKEKKKILNTKEQVEQLIEEATNPENLCLMFKGWYPWW